MDTTSRLLDNNRENRVQELNAPARGLPDADRFAKPTTVHDAIKSKMVVGSTDGTYQE